MFLDGLHLKSLKAETFVEVLDILPKFWCSAINKEPFVGPSYWRGWHPLENKVGDRM